MAKFKYYDGTQWVELLKSSDISAWAKASSKPSYTHNEIGAGNLTVGNGSQYLNMRSGHDNYDGGIYYSTPGNEAMIFAVKSSVTSFIFKSGLSCTSTGTSWQTLTPDLQIKNGKVTINKLIENNADGSYNLDVNGTLNATTIYQNGTTLANTYLGISSQASDSAKLNGQSASYYQTALSSQTAYTSKGSATKVPQITTNSLGQVTGITEVTITQPTVNNATLTIQAAGTSKGTFTANASSDVTINITAADLGLSNAMHFIGSSSTAITDGGTENPTISGYTGTAKTSGNVVLYGGKEFVWTGSAWEQLGDESSWALNSVTVTGTGALGGGGALTGNQTITHNAGSAASKTSGFYKFSTDAYSHVGGVTAVVKKDLTDLITSMSAASGGADLSLVTTGEKYTWNNKSNFTGYSSSNKLDGAYINNTQNWSSFSGYSSSNKLNSDYITNNAGWTSNSGTVTSVGLSMPGIFTVTNSPVTSSGTLTASLNVQSPNKVFAGPSSGSNTGAPSFRSLVAADIPDLSSVYLGASSQAADSAKLNGQNASYYLNYNNFTNTPTIPTNNNQLTNGAGYITSSGSCASATSSTVADNVTYLTSAPSSNNTSGRLKFVVLSSEPSTKYSGYVYIITG